MSAFTISEDGQARQREGFHNSTLPRPNSDVIKDQTWDFSHRITFHKPSFSRRSTCGPAVDGRLAESEPSVGLKHLTNQSLPATSTWTAALDLRPSKKLAYPDLSSSSFAATSHEPFCSLSKPTETKSWNREPQPPDNTEPPLTAQNIRFNADPTSEEGPFCSPLGFHIPRSKLQHALCSKPESATSYWQYTLYQGPEGEKQKVKLHYCKSREATEAVAEMFLKEEVIGFDVEWMAQAKSTAGIKRNVSLIQIASEERIALFHLARYPGAESVEDFVTPKMKQIMESPDITKVGVAIKGDCTKLRNFLGIQSQGLFELSYLHKLVKYCAGEIEKVDRRNVRLADQVQEHLKLPLLKGDVQTSDWSRDLDYQQTQYAASDSYAGLQLYHILEAKRKAFDPCPPRPAHAEKNLAISLGDQERNGQHAEVFEEYLDDSSDIDSVSGSDMSVEELAREYFHVSLSDNSQVKPKTSGRKPAGESNDPESPLSAPDTSTSTTPAPSNLDASPEKRHISPELALANQFVAQYQARSTKRVAPQTLRAYALWHEQRLSIPKVASLLRHPPVQNKTVITYLCDAFTIGNLKCDSKRMLEASSHYDYKPFLKAHKDLFERARRECAEG